MEASPQGVHRRHWLCPLLLSSAGSMQVCSASLGAFIIFIPHRNVFSVMAERHTLLFAPHVTTNHSLRVPEISVSKVMTRFAPSYRPFTCPLPPAPWTAPGGLIISYPRPGDRWGAQLSPLPRFPPPLNESTQSQTHSQASSFIFRLKYFTSLTLIKIFLRQ